MPRIWDTDAIALGLIDQQTVDEFQDDPGNLPPYDFCIDCYNFWQPEGDAEHPPYEDMQDSDHPYRCFMCETILSEQDNHPD